MNYANFHKVLIKKVLELSEQPLLNWEARLEANAIINDLILKRKDIKDIIKKQLQVGEVTKRAEIRTLKAQIKKVRAIN